MAFEIDHLGQEENYKVFLFCGSLQSDQNISVAHFLHLFYTLK